MSSQKFPKDGSKEDQAAWHDQLAKRVICWEGVKKTVGCAALCIAASTVFALFAGYLYAIYWLWEHHSPQSKANAASFIATVLALTVVFCVSLWFSLRLIRSDRE